MKILVTGSAGFIGYHISEHFLNTGNNVIGIDNLNDYYSPNLKKYRNNLLLQKKNFTFKELDISSKNQIEKLFQEN